MKRLTLLVILATSWVLTQPLTADDRDFVRVSAEDPYFFIIFDVSGSMNWTGSEVGTCPNGDCIAAMSGDDPRSKFYQAKKAIYEALQTADNVHFGFATYSQDRLAAENKHFRYVALTDGVPLSGSPSAFPVQGAVETFGPAFNPFCDNGGGSNNVGCYTWEPADINNSSDDYWERERVRRLPKPTPGRYFYIRTSNSTRYRLRYELANGTQVGDEFVDMLITRRRCTGSNGCNDGGTEQRTIRFQREAAFNGSPPNVFDEFLHWDNGVNRNRTRRGYFSQGQSADMNVSNTCAGWDPNTDTNNDRFNAPSPIPDYNIRYPTAAGPDHASLTYGDVIPMSWTDRHKDDILSRFAPTPGIYGAAPYFEDTRTGGRNYLRLKDPNLRPTLPHGSTPLAKSMRDFYNYVRLSWRPIAIANDIDYGCRQKYLLVITDGADTCGGANECQIATDLRINERFKTYAIGFGLTGAAATSLNCIATNGGTGSPLFPQDGDALRDAITDILNQIRQDARSFATAAVPSVDASADDAIYLTDFTPIAARSIWNGRMDAYLKPLPVTSAGLPDRTATCTSGQNAQCHLWDGGTQLLLQAPNPTEIGMGTRKLGINADERRLFYARPDYNLALFEPPTNVLDWPDLLIDFGLSDTDHTDPVVINRATAIIDQTLVVKTAALPVDPTDPMSPTFDIDYILGDTFHSDPVVLQFPSSFERYAVNLHGYRDFAERSRFRRKLLLAGSNDGQLHAFNAGIFFGGSTRSYDDGDGAEIFSFIPRMALPIIRDMAEGSTHIYGVDGPPTIEDVVIHPRVGSAGVPDPTQREWRTVIVGGLREGGLKIGGDFVQNPEGPIGLAEDFRSGFYALDITQPDTVTLVTDATFNVQRWEPTTDVIPSCLTTDATVPAGCGPVPFPTVLWEFQDLSPLTDLPLDEDPVLLGGPDGFGDLGQTWSQPIVGRILVIEAGVEVDKWVAIVGGGLDPNKKFDIDPDMGSWIYIIDIETGQAIYKHHVEGSVPQLSVLDKNDNDYLDTIYAATTTGAVYKVDLSTPQAIVPLAVQDIAGVPVTVDRVTAMEWDPFKIFQASGNRAFFLPPQVFFLARLGQYALAFGSGDRQDLWNPDAIEGRYYVIVDEDFVASDVTLPRVETDYVTFDPDDADLELPPPATPGTPPDLIHDPDAYTAGIHPGWIMTMDSEERLITEAFGLSGVIIFNSFQPAVVPSTIPGEVACTRTGVTRNFIVDLRNGNPIISLDSDDLNGTERYRNLTGFVAAPYVEQTATSNQPPGSGGSGGGGGSGGSGGSPPPPPDPSCVTDPTMVAMADAQKANGPTNAKYGNYYLRLVAQNDQGVQIDEGCFPIAVNIRNWKEN